MSAGPRFLDEDSPDELAVRSMVTPGSTGGPGPTPPVGPVLLEADPTQLDRLSDLQGPAAMTPPATRFATGPLVAYGLLGLLVTWVAISVISFVLREVRVSPILGIVAAACFAISLGLLLVAALREWRAWRALAKVDRLRRVLSANLASRDDTLDAALAWLMLAGHRLPDMSQTQVTVQEAGSAAEIRELVRLKVVLPLEARAVQLGQRAALQSAVLSATRN